MSVLALVMITVYCICVLHLSKLMIQGISKAQTLSLFSKS